MPDRKIVDFRYQRVRLTQPLKGANGEPDIPAGREGVVWDRRSRPVFGRCLVVRFEDSITNRRWCAYVPPGIVEDAED